MHARFHAPGAVRPGDVVTLPDNEARHLTHVLRLAAGHAVRVFNGRGGEFEGVVDEAGKSGARIRIGERCDAAPEARIAIALVHAVLKGDKMDDVVRDAVMMGAAAIHPIVTARSEVSLAALTRGRRRDRWQRIAISSVKQCGRAVVPPVFEPVVFSSIPEGLDARTVPRPAIMFVEPGASPDATPLGELEADPPKEATVLVGPEGGWTAQEIEEGSRRCRLVTLGGRTLRADAMSLVALAALFARWREF